MLIRPQDLLADAAPGHSAADIDDSMLPVFEADRIWGLSSIFSSNPTRAPLSYCSATIVQGSPRW